MRIIEDILQYKMVEGVGKVVKYAMIVANVIILVGGISVFSVGVWTLADRTFMERLLGSDLYVSAASIMIATGIIVTVISFLGCFGAFKEIKCMLLTFFIILLMIFVIMLVGGILGYVFRNEVDSRMHNEMLMSLNSYDNDTRVSETWEAVQTRFRCCGMTEDSRTNDAPYNIWSKKVRSFQQANGFRVPESCCAGISDKESRRSCQSYPRPDNIYAAGCYEKMKVFVKEHALVVGGVGIGIACILVIGMILSFALFWMIR